MVNLAYHPVSPCQLSGSRLARLAAIAGFTLAAVTVLAACGSSAETSSPPPPTTTSSTTTTSVTETPRLDPEAENAAALEVFEKFWQALSLAQMDPPGIGKELTKEQDYRPYAVYSLNNYFGGVLAKMEASGVRYVGEVPPSRAILPQEVTALSVKPLKVTVEICPTPGYWKLKQTSTGKTFRENNLKNPPPNPEIFTMEKKDDQWQVVGKSFGGDRTCSR